MSVFRLAVQTGGRWLPIFLCTGALSGQACLVLSPLTTSEGTASLDLTLYSSRGTAPAAVQWTFQYSPSSVSNLAVDDGPMLVATGKTAICAGNTATLNCLAVGANAKTIANGVIAKVTAVLSPGVSPPTIQIINPLAVSASGDLIPIPLKILPVTGGYVSSDCRLHPPPRGSAGGR